MALEKTFGPVGPVGSVPVPDPTVLTTAALIREIDILRERTSHDNRLLREIIEARLNGNDQAVALLRLTTDAIPTKIDAAVASLQELHEEKFASIQNQIAIQFGGISTQFNERDKRTEQLSLADKTAIAAALQAQKEAAGAQNESNTAAISKMEANFIKLIDQGQNLVKSISDGFDGKINDIKSRLDKGEGRGSVTDSAINNMLADLAREVRDLRDGNRMQAGQQHGLSSAGAMALGAVAFMSVLVAIGSFVVNATKQSGPGPGPAPGPGYVYRDPPPGWYTPPPIPKAP